MYPRLQLAVVAILLGSPLSAVVAPTAAAPTVDPLRFFEGRTQSDGLVKVIFKRAYRSRSLGQGRIEPDGSLTLVQRVEEDGKPTHERRWRVRKLAPGRYAGTMSDATSPVDIQQVGARYRFRFTMSGHLSVEEWMTPLPGAMSARTDVRISKFGITVATTEGTIVKLTVS